MKIKITASFREKVNQQVDFIARDKPEAARKFKTELLEQLNSISDMPYKHRKSIFFDQEEIRDLIFKGYIVVYRINQPENVVEIFGFTKYEENPFHD